MEDVKQLIGIDAEILDRMNVAKIEMKKGQEFFTIKDDNHSFFIVKSGLVRSFIIDDKGKEFTRIIYTQGMVVASVKTHFTASEHILKFDALTNAELYTGDFKSVIEKAQTDIDILKVYTSLLQKSFFALEERIYELKNTAEEKYLRLKERIPNIDNLIPQYQIASYLNVTNVQLSRIRKKLLYK